jgi:hypothetical protein
MKIRVRVMAMQGVYALELALAEEALKLDGISVGKRVDCLRRSTVCRLSSSGLLGTDVQRTTLATNGLYARV